MKDCELIDLALKEGFAAAALVDTADIPFDFSFRHYCEENLCGQYGANYSCPPDCGSCDAMRARIMARKRAILLQTNWEITDYTDTAAIKHAKGFHNSASLSLAQKMKAMGYPGFMVGASGCTLCDSCAVLESLPCRFPERMFSCMSAYCIYVKKLCDQCGLEYSGCTGLLGFFGLYVF